MDAVGPILFILSFIGALANMNNDMKEWGKYGANIDQEIMEEQSRY